MAVLSDKIWREALMRAVKCCIGKVGDELQYIEKVADRCVDEANMGKVRVYKEDRLCFVEVGGIIQHVFTY